MRTDRAGIMAGGMGKMTYKEKTKAGIDKYIKNCNVPKPKQKGSRREAWADVKALEILVKAAQG